MFNKILYCFLFFVPVLMAGSACGNIKKPISPADLEIIDSIVFKKLKVLEHEMDSICQLNFERYVSDAVDSILEVRILENKNLMDGGKE